MSSEIIPGGGPFKAAIGRHEPLTVDDLKAVRRAWALYCASEDKLCRRFAEMVLKTSRLVAKARLEDLRSEGYSGADLAILNVRDRLLEFYGLLLAGALVVRGERALVEAKTDLLMPDGTLIGEGDVAFVELGLAAALYAASMVEPARASSLALGEV